MVPIMNTDAKTLPCNIYVSNKTIGVIFSAKYVSRSVYLLEQVIKTYPDLCNNSHVWEPLRIRPLSG